jgi:hypothetical protein
MPLHLRYTENVSPGELLLEDAVALALEAT